MTKRTEAGICADFIEALGDEWQVYPETEGWDMLLVLTRDIPSSHFGHTHLPAGTQVGIEAKLCGNVKVLVQALPSRYAEVMDLPGPDYRAVLVPKCSGEFSELASYLGIVVLTEKPSWDGEPHRNARELSDILLRSNAFPASERHPLPEVIPDSIPGSPSPVTVSAWKLKAIKLCILLRDRGYLTIHDFRQHGIDHRRWYNNWIVKGEKVGPEQRWVRAPDWKPWDEIHPGVVAQLSGGQP